MKPTGRALKIPVDFVTKDGYEICVICHDETKVKADTHIELREYYIEGFGQLCKNCGKKFG